MCKTKFMRESITRDDCNFIISNVILSQKKDFVIDDIIREVKSLIGDIVGDIERSVNLTLTKLSEAGFLHVLGSIYSVGNINI